MAVSSRVFSLYLNITGIVVRFGHYLSDGSPLTQVLDQLIHSGSEQVMDEIENEASLPDIPIASFLVQVELLVITGEPGYLTHPQGGKIQM